MEKLNQFMELHKQEQAFLLGNVWDVASAKCLEELGFKALGTSSAAMAAVTGKQDGIDFSFEDLLYFTEKILSSTHLPVSVDMEHGYGESAAVIASNIERLLALGVVGINLEDSVITLGSRNLVDANLFKQKLIDIHKLLGKRRSSFFLNIRLDAFLLHQGDEAMEIAKGRIKELEAIGIDGIFLPGLKNKSDILSIIDSTKLPINLMALPGIDSTETLSTWGVKRISTGNFGFDWMHEQFKGQFKKLMHSGNLSLLFE
jgi:2-methylisocitrate lyase-like PEP mutase family enzyme